MIKRILALLLLLTLTVPALAEEEELPVLIDRIEERAGQAPKNKYPDFAFAEDAELLEVIFPQMLNCDAIFLRCGGETMLVDACTKGQAVRILNMCKQMGITHIDRVVNTHPHEDHIGGFRNLIKEVEVDELWICFPEDYNNHMTAAVEAAKKADIQVKTYADGDTLTLGGATIDVWKLEGDISEMNDCSAQLMVRFGERTFLMAADLQPNGQKRLTDLKGDALDADILKYPHHGIEVLQEDYLKAVSPMFLVITNNEKNRDGSKWIKSQKEIPFAFTVPNLVHLTTDGVRWIVEKIPSDVKY